MSAFVAQNKHRILRSIIKQTHTRMLNPTKNKLNELIAAYQSNEWLSDLPIRSPSTFKICGKILKLKSMKLHPSKPANPFPISSIVKMSITRRDKSFVICLHFLIISVKYSKLTIFPQLRKGQNRTFFMNFSLKLLILIHPNTTFWRIWFLKWKISKNNNPVMATREVIREKYQCCKWLFGIDFSTKLDYLWYSETDWSMLSRFEIEKCEKIIDFGRILARFGSFCRFCHLSSIKAVSV